MAKQNPDDKQPSNRHASRGRFWYDFGRFNLTGWSIVLPTMAGLLLGSWLDDVVPVSFSWKLPLMFAGLVLGSWNAWYWIRRIDDRRHREDRRKR
jgi:ATP synthase protein I